jgi:molybdopterin-binding protein
MTMPPSTTGDSFSARNHFPGVVRSVEVDGVMALVKIEAGPHLVTRRSPVRLSKNWGWRPA